MRKNSSKKAREAAEREPSSRTRSKNKRIKANKPSNTAAWSKINRRCCLEREKGRMRHANQSMVKPSKRRPLRLRLSCSCWSPRTNVSAEQASKAQNSQDNQGRWFGEVCVWMIWQPVREKAEEKARSNSNIRGDRFVWSGLEWISCMIVSMVLVGCEKGGGCAKSR